MTYDRCIIVTQEDRCTNKASCHWEVGTMDVCEWPSTTPTVFEPGCCVMDDSQNPRWQETCADFWNEDLCMRPMDDSDQNRCRWIPTGEDEDCEDYAPTPQPTDAQTPWPTNAPEVGCCKGYSVGTNEFCNNVPSKNACDKAGVCDWISNGVIDVDCTVPTEPPYIWPTPSPAEDPTEGEPGCCTGNSPRTWAYCETVDTEHRCDMAEECSWISGPVDAPECVAPIPTPWPTRAPVLPPSKPTYDPNGCCAGTEYDADSWEFCEQFDDDAAACERRGICSWKVGDDEFCESDSNSTWPTPPPADWPTHSGAGCCYGAVPYNAYCFGKDNERKCDRSPDCEWRETDDATECLEETPAPVMPTKWPTTTPGSLDSSEEDEGCCKGYSAQTNNFCNGIDNAGACGHAGVCDWMNGGTLEDDCSFPTDPPAEWPTPPPAEIPTEAGPGCCTGNSPRTWAYCETVDEQVRCERAHECSWVSGPVDAPECVSPTNEPTDEPTPWPTANPTAFVAGCCFGDSPKSNAFCAEMDDDRSGCRKSNRCDWIETDDSNECRLTEPPAPTYPSGCCAGHTPQSWTFCTQIDDAADCISKGQCDWLLTDDPADEVCSPPTPWPTPMPSTPLPGCCSSDGPSTFERCFAIDNNDQCTRRSSCHWIETEDPTECHVPSTTTAPGCCYISPEQDAGSIWFDNCIAFYTEGECTRPSDKMGRERCFWTETEEDELCSDLFTTASPTSAPSYSVGCCKPLKASVAAVCEAADHMDKCNRNKNCEWMETTDFSQCEVQGCCKGDSPMSNERCNWEMWPDMCDRMSGCHWIDGDDADCSWEDETTGEPAPPGCCSIFDDRKQTVDNGWRMKCTRFSNEEDCVEPTGTEDIPRCHWTPTDDPFFDCSQVWPTPHPTAAPEPGCCAANAGESELAAERCHEAVDEEACDRRSSCHWRAGEEADCTFTTTTETPTPPGCCTVCDFNGDGYPDANGWGSLCTAYYKEDDCMRPTNADGDRKCCWTETEEDFDCRLIWPTTAEPSPGCCAGDSKRSTARCADEDDYFVCTRMSSCHWIEYDDASDDESLCAWPTTTPTPQEPGCCYVSSYMGLGGPWEDRCKLAWTERECLMARDQDDVHRCSWMDAPSDFDCRQVWPTPPVEEGCCAGKNEDSADWCNEVDTMARCDRKSNCYWIETDDFTECEYESYNTTALIEDGCCYIADTQNPMSGWRERCTEFYSSDSCERPLDQSDNNRCVWEDTSPDFDCREVWPSTTTEAPGCCGAENVRSYDTCRAIDESHRCERMSSCFWLPTEDESECEMSTTGPADPGCCYINDASYLGTRWETVCEEMNREGACVGVQHGNTGDFVCEWTSMPSETDCIVLWPTPEPEIGCCTGNSFASMDRCVAETDQGKCDRMSICHWLHTEDHSECLETETTESPPPGCCMLADTRPSAYSNGWDDTCKAYHTEEACVRPYSQDGHARCVWQDTEEDFDCMNLWPTVGPTTPPAPGCCNGETLRSSERCILSVEEDHCNRMSSCSWIVTDDPTECDYVEPTVPPPEPGCCNEATGAYSAGGHSRWTTICRTFNTEMDCMTPLDQTSGDYRCEWTPTVEDFNCAITWPTTLPPQEGCCKGDAPRTNVRCNGYENEDKCLRMSSCQWVVTEDMTDIEAEQACEFIETTDVPPAPGCCMLDDVRPMSYEMGWDGQCITYATEQRCITPQSQDGTQRCRWEETGDDVDCSQLC